MHGILLLAFITALSAEAKNYALVLGGVSLGRESRDHEFLRPTVCATMGLRSKQYDVTTLFGALGKTQVDRLAKNRKQSQGRMNDVAPFVNETEKYKKNYEYLKNRLGVQSPATDKALEKYFNTLVGRVRPGDKIEIAIFAHGYSKCTGSTSATGIKLMFAGEPPDDMSKDCAHEFSILNEEGEEIRYPTEQLVGYIRQLEEKGALPNLILSSCHSGRVKRFVKPLKNTCTFTLSAGDSGGYACFEDDRPESRDYTSTAEMIVLRYCADQLGTLAGEPAFKDSQCLKKVRDHYVSHRSQIDLSNIQSTYWTSRRFDQALHEPALSTLLSFSYFNRGHYGSTFEHSSTKLRGEETLLSIDSLAEMFKARPEVIAARRLLAESLNAYNASIEAQGTVVGASARATDEATIGRIGALQETTRRLAQQVVERERALIEQLRQLGAQFVGSEAPNACTRTL